MVDASITRRRPWTARRLYFTSLTIYTASFALPAVINPNPTPSFGWVELWGWEAAQISLATPMAVIFGPSNLGYAAAAVLVHTGSRRAAIACSAGALLSMAICGIMLPLRAGGGPIRWPGGLLGPGYFAWVAAGVMMLVCGVRAYREARNKEMQTLGINAGTNA